MASKKVEPDGIDKLLFFVAVILIIVSLSCIAISLLKPLSRPVFEQMYGSE